jgi:L-threonylcarbamoyladenylate synthase
VTSILRGDDPAAIRRAAALLRAGRLVAFPTETVYGLGADALDPGAVARLFEVKGRPRFDPLIVHVASPAEIDRYADRVDPRARALVARFWPGPLTLVLPRRADAAGAPVIPDIVTSGLDTVALRMPDHPVARALLAEVGRPVAAPSANPFGYVSPTEAVHVVEQLGGAVDLVLDGGPCPVGVESTVVALAGGRPRLLRPGGVPLEAIEAAIGPVAAAPAGAEATPEAPGQLPSHYAPRTPLTLLAGRDDAERHARRRPDERVGLLALVPVPAPDAARFAAVEVLSSDGDLREAAQRLFGALRRLDAAGLDRIVAEPCPDVGLGRAIMDRLRRAAA